MKTTYKIMKCPPYDKGAPKTYWIVKKVVKWFGLITTTKIIGDYKIDDTYGELGEMPFFSKKEAKQTLKQMKKDE